MINQANALKELSVCYFGALHAAVASELTEDVAERAEELGVRAAVLELGTLDMAKIHEEALAELIPGGGESKSELGLKARAADFFNAMLVPIERGHAAAMEVGTGILNVKRALKKRTEELASAGRKLKEGIAKRKNADAFLKESREKSARLLKESRVLEGELKAITQKLLETQETKRKTMSSRLHEEIAVTLLAIHVRLLALKKVAAVNQASLSEEIATARRLVDQSVKMIKNFNEEYGIPHEA